MPRPLLDTSPRFLEEAFRFNVSAGHALVRAAVPRMLEGDHPGGAIVSISSVMGHVAGRGYLGYGTVKGALEQYTRLASRDLAPRIRVNAIGVGSTATSALDIVMSSDELRTAMEDATPLKRLGHVDDIAAAILYLVSPAGSYVTGKILEVDGGLQSPNLEMPTPRPLRRPPRRHRHAVPRRAVEHRQRRAPLPWPGSTPTPSSSSSGSSSPTPTRWATTPASWPGSAAPSAWPRRATSTPCSP